MKLFSHENQQIDIIHFVLLLGQSNLKFQLLEGNAGNSERKNYDDIIKQSYSNCLPLYNISASPYPQEQGRWFHLSCIARAAPIEVACAIEAAYTSISGKEDASRCI